MMDIKKLRTAAKKAVEKVQRVESGQGSSFNDIAHNISKLIFSSTMLERKTRDSSENREFFRDYFRALNDYINLINQNSDVSYKERFGDIHSQSPVCAMPFFRNMDDDEAKSLGYRGQKIAYVGLLKRNFI